MKNESTDVNTATHSLVDEIREALPMSDKDSLVMFRIVRNHVKSIRRDAKIRNTTYMLNLIRSIVHKSVQVETDARNVLTELLETKESTT